jgi:hypothetical protein
LGRSSSGRERPHRATMPSARPNGEPGGEPSEPGAGCCPIGLQPPAHGASGRRDAPGACAVAPGRCGKPRRAERRCGTAARSRPPRCRAARRRARWRGTDRR